MSTVSTILNNQNILLVDNVNEEEILALIETRKVPAAPIYLIGKEFWQPFDHAIKEHMLGELKLISKTDRELYIITDDINEVVDGIQDFRQHHAHSE